MHASRLCCVIDLCDVMSQVFSGMIRKATEEKVLMEWIQ